MKTAFAPVLTRKTWLLAAMLVMALLVQACAPAAAPAAQAPAAGEQAAAGAPVKNALGKELPADAAPLDQQVYVYPYRNETTFTTVDFYENVYQRGDALTDLLSDSLTRLDKNFEIQPGGATEWSVDDTGLIWTFKLDPNLMWNDGTPVTANDWLATFQYGADPKHAWDFTWYFNGVIKNWEKAVGGEVPVTDIGVKAIDDHTLQFETQTPAPYLPAMLIYSTTLSKKALETTGPLYNSNVETSVSSGPYKLTEWTKNQRVVYEINPDYKGTNVPYIQKVIVPGYGDGTVLAAYQNNEIDFMPAARKSPADQEIILADPDLQAQYHPHYGDFRTWYFFFDDQTPPFNDLRVRQAFAYAYDREAIAANVVKQQGIPAYSYLMPGFPDSNSEGFKTTYAYDIEKAKQLLADAGFPNGEGFPKLTLKLRSAAALPQAVAQAYASTLNKELGLNVEVSNMEFKTFMEELNAKPTGVQFGQISYGMDFLDPSNMLGVFLSGGRHNWNNAEFDKMVKEASSMTGDPAARTKMFQDAEKLLVDDVAGVWMYHETPGDLYKPYVKGTALEPDKNGKAAMHWPGFSGFSTNLQSIYISNDVSNYRSTPPQ